MPILCPSWTACAQLAPLVHASKMFDSDTCVCSFNTVHHHICTCHLGLLVCQIGSTSNGALGLVHESILIRNRQYVFMNVAAAAAA